MDEFEWLRKNSPPTTPSRDTTQRHRTQLRAAIATEGADGTRPRRPRRGLRSRHRVLVTGVVVVVLCAAGAGIVALADGGGDESGHIGAPAASGSTSTTTTPTCSGPLPVQFNVPTEFGSGVAGPATAASDPVESGQQVTRWSSGATTFEIRWPADASERKFIIPTPQQPGDTSSSMSSDTSATVDGKGVARRRAVATFASQVSECQSIQITVYGTDADLVNSLMDAFVQAPYHTDQPLVTTTRAAASAPSVVPCAGPVDAGGKAIAVVDVKFVPTVGGDVTRGVFAKPEDALADFVEHERHLIQDGYQGFQLPDGSISYAVEPRPGAVVTAVHVTASGDGWTVRDWSASGC